MRGLDLFIYFLFFNSLGFPGEDGARSLAVVAGWLLLSLHIAPRPPRGVRDPGCFRVFIAHFYQLPGDGGGSDFGSSSGLGLRAF